MLSYLCVCLSEDVRSSGNRVTDYCALEWVLGNESGSSGKATSAFSCWTISPAQILFFNLFLIKNVFFVKMYSIYFAYFSFPSSSWSSSSSSLPNFLFQKKRNKTNKKSRPSPKPKVKKKDKKALRMSKQTMKQMPLKVLFSLLLY